MFFTIKLFGKIMSFNFPPKNKNAATEVTAQKTQTPIVAKPTEAARTKSSFASHSVGICIFIKFNISMMLKGYSYTSKNSSC